ncbi:MAG: adenylosuccinate lyase [Candidatus Doudnabacteria bacterium]
MINRYTRGPMGKIWSEDQRLRNWVRVDVEAMRARAQLGEISVAIPDDLQHTINIDAGAIEELETKEGGTGHDVMAFLDYTSPQLPPALRPHWHYYMTSMDCGDTGLMLQLVESLTLIQEDIIAFMLTLRARAHEFKYTPMIGRTHTVHAEPITFGVKLANWHDEMGRHFERTQQLMKRLTVGKLSGAVGMYTLPPNVEQIVCQRLGLVPTITTQVISRDIIAEYVTVLGLIAGSIRKFAMAGRLMQQTEVRELQEAFRKGQKGSSAMPHKRNSIGAENVSGLAAVIQGYTHAAYENQLTLHERDISNSGSERIILPDASILIDYILARFTRIVKGWSVFPDRMLYNLSLTKGLIFSQDVQALLADKSGLPRQEAHALAYDIAQACWETGADFKQALLDNPRIASLVSPSDIESCFVLDEKLKYIDHIFDQVFGTHNGLGD